MVLASYEVLLRQEWARANNITGVLTMASRGTAPTTDRSIKDSAEGTYVWNHSEESCPDTIVKLYSGPIKVLTNTSSTFNGGLAIVEGRDKNQVAGLELTETFLLCGRAAQKTHIRNIVVFFHPMSQIQVASGQVRCSHDGSKYHQAGVRAQFPAGQGNYDTARAHSASERRYL